MYVKLIFFNSVSLRMLRFVFHTVLIFCSFSLTGQVDLVETHLPLIKIYTQGQSIEDDPKVLVRCEITDNPQGMNQVGDFPNVYKGFVGIEIRGQSSSLFDKKSYGIEFRDAAGEDLDVEILGFPKEEDFVLHGPYSDKSLIRNAIVYSMAADMMEYAPRCRFVELLIDDKYKGLYLFVEKIKRDINRVDIEKIKKDDIEGEALKGGYIIKFDKSDIAQETLWYSPYTAQGVNVNPAFIASYPKAADIEPEQIDYIRGFVTDFEHALAADDFTYKGKNYKEYIDVGTFIDYMLISELTKNLDSYRVSTFMYKSRGGKLKLGPVWDYNLALGNANFCASGDPEGWQYDFNSICPWDNWLNHFWWRRFLEDEEFVELLKERYLELRRSEFNLLNLYRRIDSLVVEVGDAAARNFDQHDVLGKHLWPNVFVGETHAQEILYLKQWLLKRVAFMDENLVDGSVASDPESMPLLYPNPNLGYFAVTLGKHNEEAEKILIYNSEGKVVTETAIENRSKVWFVEDFDHGMYYMRLINREGKTVGKFMKFIVF